MGGNAFEATERLSEDAYHQMCQRISDILNQLGLPFRFPLEIKDKAELVAELKGSNKPYGDVDVLVAAAGSVNPELLDTIELELECPKGRVCHGKTYSFLTKDLYQVDILFCSTEEELDFLNILKSNNDFMPFLGHLLSPFNLKLTERGLVLTKRSSNVKKEIVLTRDMLDVCELFGFPNHVMDGKTPISTNEAMESLLKSSLYFHKDEYCEKYRRREGRKGRPMIDKMFDLLRQYDGRFESDKEPTELRKAIQAFHESQNRDDFDNFILERFGKVQEWQGILCEVKSKTLVEEQKNKFFSWLLTEFFPDQKKERKQKKAVEVMKSLRKRAQSDNQTFTEWQKNKSQEEIKVIINEIIQDLPV